MDKQARIRQLRRNLLLMLAGLVFSYAISIGLSLFLLIDSGIIDGEFRWPIIIGFGVGTSALGYIHVRAQFRRYDYMVRLAESEEEI